MGGIDVSDIVADPDFCDNLLLLDRVSKTDLHGENQITDCTIVTVGIVQPASGKTIQRLPEALQVQNVSSFWLKGKIMAAAPGKYTSVIVYKGLRYQIQMVFDWTNWGSGWCEGVCIAEVPA